ncbi:MAG: DUF2167 domain-containing protein [Planctomycetes bacterium]|nr:DUF2167 domain-containing protein [Planctomycetota bacterium]
MRSRVRGVVVLAVFVSLVAATSLRAQEPPSEPRPFEWQPGPTQASLGSQGILDVPEGYLFLGGRETRRLLEMMENPTSGEELGTLTPADENENWFLFFEFDDVGYVDDDQSDLDADDLLDSLREGTEAGNEERRAHGWQELTITGWRRTPYYNPSTNNLEWAVDVRTAGQADIGINHDVRLLGREGVMRVSLVCDAADYARVAPQIDSLLSGFAFRSGRRYDEFQSGDKIAEYTLGTLVTGAVLAKTGLLQKLWKVIVAALVGLAALFKKIVRAVTGRRDPEAAEPPQG